MPVALSPLQVPALQRVPCTQRRQAPLPSQVPSGRAGGADRGIVGCSLPRNRGTNTKRVGKIAGHAGLPTGHVATDPVRAESGPAFPIAATGFSRSLGLAGRFRRASVGRGNVGGLAIVPPAIAQDLFVELGRRAPNRGQGNIHKSKNWLPHGSSPAFCRSSARTVAILFAPHRAGHAACTPSGEAADLLADACHAGVLRQAVARSGARCLAAPG